MRLWQACGAVEGDGAPYYVGIYVVSSPVNLDDLANTRIG
jgi:hypothetical protein